MGGETIDGRTLARLYEQHGPMVYRRALRILGNPEDAQEALQEVFIRVMRGSDDFEQRSTTTTWLYRITTNYCLNTLRDRRRRDELMEIHGTTAENGATTGMFDAFVMRGLLARADEREGQAAVYVFVDGMSHDEVAELLGVSRRTVGNLLERFQAWAQAELQGCRERPSSGTREQERPQSAVTRTEVE
ncbi:MAG: RNA polymerase sigma factor [Myxococcales bacterium]